ncbi:hypothetical protein SK128_023078 [Halocaridina rubra]|uniref:Uncharacterized protein n=1 Tax=Halocaridina rubra TaxID=373956 RepID=A0AAN8WSM1_HALRR
MVRERIYPSVPQKATKCDRGAGGLAVPSSLNIISCHKLGIRRREVGLVFVKAQFEYYKSKRRRKRVKRRNTIADTRDARIALADREGASTSSGRGISSPRSGSPSSRGGVSYTDRSFDTTETLETTSSTTKASSDREHQLHSLGLDINIPVPPRNVHTVSRRMAKETNSFRDNEVINTQEAGSSGSESRLVNGGAARNSGCPRNLIYETVKSANRDSSADKRYPQKSHLPISTHSSAMNVAVKLREGTRDDGTHSSSGNWSASSSTRTSVESDHQRPVASPTSSLEQDSIISESLHIRSSSPSSNQRTNSRTTDDIPSTSSHASDGTLTPTQDIQDIPFLDDDTSSAFSCDTEGYYTSFHIDSGLRSVSYDGDKLASESDYETFGKGSTGTTNSSASLGTVVMRNPEKKTPPKPPQRVSSLERKRESTNRESIITVIHVNGSTSSREDVVGDLPDKSGSQDGDSRSSRDGDSGRETSSSPTEPTSPRQPSLPSPELEFSESDIEADRQEILRVKTSINSSRIPSMCVITPPQSDDESVRSGSISLSRDNSGSQVESQGQQTSLGTTSSSASQGNVSSIASKFHMFQNSGAKSTGASGGSKGAAETAVSEKNAAKHVGAPHSYTPTLTVIPKGKDGDINAHLKGIMHTAAIASPARASTEQPVLIKPSLVKQAEKEKRLSQETDSKQKPTAGAAATTGTTTASVTATAATSTTATTTTSTTAAAAFKTTTTDIPSSARSTKAVTAAAATNISNSPGSTKSFAATSSSAVALAATTTLSNATRGPSNSSAAVPTSVTTRCSYYHWCYNGIPRCTYTRSPFQRNNSYKLATAPLSEAANSIHLMSDAQKLVGDNVQYQLPMINNTTIHGPRVNNLNRQEWSRSPLRMSVFPNSLTNMGQGKSQAVKRPVSPLDPGQAANPNLFRRRFYGAQVINFS